MNRKSVLDKIKEKKFKKLCENIVADMKRLDVPGVAVGIWYNGEEFSAGLGITSVENPLPITPETLFQIGSISKTFTGTLLMQQIEKGRLNLDTPIRTYLPKLKLSDALVAEKVTTRHLLNHTGGWIGDYFNDFGTGNDALAKMVKSISDLPQITPLGEVWSYNNTGFNIAGRLVEVLNHKPYEKAAHKQLIDPLGLRQTFFYPDDRILTNRFVAGHSRQDGKTRVALPWAVGRAINPVGGVVSTVVDLLKYARFHMGTGRNSEEQQILARESLEAMRFPQAEAGGRGKICITWFMRQAGELTVFGHGGATHGQQASLQIIPEKDFALAILTNSDSGGTITDHTFRWALEIYFNAALPAPIAKPKTDAELLEYAGMYDLPLSAFNLEVKDGYLLCQEIPRGGFPTPQTPPGPADPPVRLGFYDQDRVVILDEPGQGSLGEFLRDTDGRLKLFRLGGRVHPKIK